MKWEPASETVRVCVCVRRFHGEGYQEGYAEGRQAGAAEGRRHGARHGARVGAEVRGKAPQVAGLGAVSRGNC